jgi:hypothetical protein
MIFPHCGLHIQFFKPSVSAQQPSGVATPLPHSRGWDLGVWRGPGKQEVESHGLLHPGTNYTRSAAVFMSK